MRKALFPLLVASGIMGCKEPGAILSAANMLAGNEQRVNLAVAPGLPISEFDCVLEYDADALALESIVASEAARDNGVVRIRYREPRAGRIRIATESSPTVTPKRISHLATLSFVALPSSHPGPRRICFPYHKLRCRSAGRSCVLPAADGEICVVAPQPARLLPSPGRDLAEGNVRMDATNTFFPGETPAIRYFVKPNGWENSLVDVYVAALLPDGRLLYFDTVGGITPKCVPADRRININNLNGIMQFYTCPADVPLGHYFFYATLTHVGGNPLDPMDRVSNLDTARFEVVIPPPGFSPRPLPKVKSRKWSIAETQGGA